MLKKNLFVTGHDKNVLDADFEDILLIFDSVDIMRSLLVFFNFKQFFLRDLRKQPKFIKYSHSIFRKAYYFKEEI